MNDATFTSNINTLLGWIQNEMARGRLTAVQATFLTDRVNRLEAAYAAVEAL